MKTLALIVFSISCCAIWPALVKFSGTESTNTTWGFTSPASERVYAFRGEVADIGAAYGGKDFHRVIANDNF